MLQVSLAEEAHESTNTLYYKINELPAYRIDGIPFRVFVRATCSDFAARYAYHLIYEIKKMPVGDMPIEGLWYSTDNINFILIDTESSQFTGPTAEEIIDLKLDVRSTTETQQTLHDVTESSIYCPRLSPEKNLELNNNYKDKADGNTISKLDVTKISKENTDKVSKPGLNISMKKKRPSKSHVWTYFRENKDGGDCMICEKTVKASNTTNLNNHLIRHHNDIPKIKSMIENSQTEHNLSSTEVVKPDELHSHCNQPESNTNLSVQHSSSNKTQVCQSSGVQPRIDSSIARITSHKKGGSIVAAITNALVYMIAKDDMPLNTTEKPGFKYFIKVAAPLYQVPCRTSITTSVDNKYKVLSAIIKDKLKEVPYFTLTTGIWTEINTTTSFLGFTLHFIETSNLRSLVLGVTELKNRHTSANIQNEFVSLCTDWGIPLSKVICVITDNGANIAKAARDTFGEERHIACFAHTLNLVLSTVMNNIDVLRELIGKVKSIVTFFKHSVVASDALKKVQIAVSKKSQCPSGVLEEEPSSSSTSGKKSSSSTPLKLVKEVPTRWNSTFYMLRRFIQLKDAVSSVLLDFPQSPPMLTAAEIEISREILIILSPIEAITVEMCAQKYTTCSRVIPILHCLETNLKLADIKLPITINFREIIIKVLNERFRGISKSHLHSIATILDPRFKRLNFTESTDASGAISYIDDLLKKEKRSSMHASKSSVNEKKVTNYSVWKYHIELAEKHNFNKEERCGSFGLDFDFKNYITQKVLDIDANPIKYWQQEEKNAPELTKIALKFLSTVATSVPCERLFPMAGNVHNESRNRLTGDHLSRLLFLKSLDFSEWCL